MYEACLLSSTLQNVTSKCMNEMETQKSWGKERDLVCHKLSKIHRYKPKTKSARRTSLKALHFTTVQSSSSVVSVLETVSAHSFSSPGALWIWEIDEIDLVIGQLGNISLQKPTFTVARWRYTNSVPIMDQIWFNEIDIKCSFSSYRYRHVHARCPPQKGVSFLLKVQKNYHLS